VIAACVAAPTEIDMATVEAFRTELRATILEHRCEIIGVDLGAVTFMDSVGLGVLIGCRKYALGWGGDLVLVSPSRLVVKTLRATGLHTMLPIDLQASAATAALP
jgi:anti-anti-sigma factor